MFTPSSHDPVLYDQLRREQPRLHANHIDLLRLAHHDGLRVLAEVDGELEVLAARRRQVCRRLAVYRERLWAGAAARAHRRPLRPPEAPMPPAPVDAQRIGGSALRRVAVAILRRHGPLPLRELHGLLHRYGYEISSERPVQRLADALAYEVRNGRLERLERGVYGVAGVPPERVSALDLGDPLPWSSPSTESWDDPAPIDVDVADDPERWTDGRWPAAAQLGSSMCAGPPDRDVAELATDLDATVAAARERLAGLIAHRLGPPSHVLAGRRSPTKATDDELLSGAAPDPVDPEPTDGPDRPPGNPTVPSDSPPDTSPDDVRDDSSTIRSEGSEPGDVGGREGSGRPSGSNGVEGGDPPMQDG